ncbi:MAG: carboxypeptidase-like regulatory domain-containing protein, partial [Nanoarchaeota archaeon]|nr:carboxypeptidase-like regulatory domain-containing protein [Nanoarchaeota archaeon]
MKRIIFLFFILILSINMIYAIPQIPVSFIGTVKGSDDAVAANEVITAVSNIETKDTTTDASGVYNIRFDADNPDTSVKDGLVIGDRVEFKYEGSIIKTITVSDFGNTIVDLTIPKETSSSSSESIVPEVETLENESEEIINQTQEGEEQINSTEQLIENNDNLTEEGNLMDDITEKKDEVKNNNKLAPYIIAIILVIIIIIIFFRII